MGRKKGVRTVKQPQSPFRLGEPDLSNIREMQELLGEPTQVAAVRRGIREYLEILKKRKK